LKHGSVDTLLLSLGRNSLLATESVLLGMGERLAAVQVTQVLEEEWSYIPVGGPLPLGSQHVTAFGAAANLVHPATGYSIARSLREAPALAAAMAAILSRRLSVRQTAAQVWDSLWPAEKRRQVCAAKSSTRQTPYSAHNTVFCCPGAADALPFCCLGPLSATTVSFKEALGSLRITRVTCPQAAFHVFGMELLAKLDLRATNAFFSTFFRLPDFYWRGFLASSLSSPQLIIFALLTFALAPPSIQLALMRHLITDPAGSYLIRHYAGRLGMAHPGPYP
jgi:hypothetical protein